MIGKSNKLLDWHSPTVVLYHVARKASAAKGEAEAIKAAQISKGCNL